MDTFIMQINTTCPFNCLQCYMCHDDYSMSLCDVEKIINDAKRKGVKHFQITGGEPLIHPDIIEIVKKLKQNNFLVAIATSGYNFQLFNKLFKIGLDVICISMNGSNKEINDKTRESFETAFAAMRICYNFNYPYLINWVPNRTNIDDLPNLINMAKKRYCQGICILRPMFSYKNHIDMTLELNDIQKIANIIRNDLNYISIEPCFKELNNILGHNINCDAKFNSRFIDVKGEYHICSLQGASKSKCVLEN